jgi:hypothetical protein
MINQHAMAEPGSTSESEHERTSGSHVAPVAPAHMAVPKTLANGFIVLFLGYQIGMPLTYYLSERVYDERFSWRMFSTVRLQECDVQVSERLARGGDTVERPVVLEQDLQVAWINVLKRLRPAVVQKYLQRRCAATHAQAVTLRGQCVDTGGQTLPERRFELRCESGQWTQEPP